MRVRNDIGMIVFHVGKQCYTFIVQQKFEENREISPNHIICVRDRWYAHISRFVIFVVVVDCIHTRPLVRASVTTLNSNSNSNSPVETDTLVTSCNHKKEKEPITVQMSLEKSVHIHARAHVGTYIEHYLEL